MSHELICGWLGLKPEEWPPDHYQLLGLRPGEGDADLIEQRVHQRLETVRCYQMLHPEQATEAMNRLAQAFVCLTEPNTKQMYDAGLFGRAPVPVGVVLPTSAAEADTVIETKNPLSGLNSPPPLPKVVPPPLPVVGQTAESKIDGPTHTPPVTPPPLPVLPPLPPPEPVDTVVLAAQTSREARRGLGTKRALYYRIARTRKLLGAWDLIGQHLATPKKRPLRRSEVAELLDRIAEVRELLRRFPPILGEAGQPGYLVLALDQLEPAVLQRISPSQRESLGRDWKTGHKLLAARRDFLRQEARTMRKRSWEDRFSRALRAYVTDQPAAVLVLLGLLALNIALWRSHVLFWPWR